MSREGTYKFIICFLGALIIYKIIWPLFQDPDWETTIKKAKKSIVFITSSNGAGTGFLISDDGTIVTNSHVIGDAGNIEVSLHNKVMYKASVIKKGTLPFDIAVIKIPRGKYDYLEFADSDKCIDGEEVAAIGYPSGKEASSVGVVSNCDRSDLMLNMKPIKDILAQYKNARLIQITAKVAAGSSGGPLLNRKGKVLGVVTWKYLLNPWHSEYNIAIAANTVSGIVENKYDVLEKQLSEISKNYELLTAFWGKEYQKYLSRADFRGNREYREIVAGAPLHAHPSDYEDAREWILALSIKIQSQGIKQDEAEAQIAKEFQDLH